MRTTAMRSKRDDNRLNFSEPASPVQHIATMFSQAFLLLWRWCIGSGGRHIVNLFLRSARRVRRNLTMSRLASFPHLLVAIWLLVLMWGERWVFSSKVHGCDWAHWEQWPSGATPHHLIFVADPQLIDPHSYPGRPWPINPLTVMVTDNYLRRSYTNLQFLLRPDTTMFLGDLFDGGREWKTSSGDFEDPSWARPHPKDEAPYVSGWNKQYGEDYWLKEYMRFNDIFFAPFNLAGSKSTAGQRGRKIIASLPGNHDLGFGAQVKIPVRDRFRAYFGEENRIDIIGNHSIVSVDTVSLSAGTSEEVREHDSELKPIYEPADTFLEHVKTEKRKAIEKELRFWRGEVEEVGFSQDVSEAARKDFSNSPSIDPGSEAERGDFPTILLTHVPLFRPPGTPCGPMRERWPPTPPGPGEGPVAPDKRNAISVSAGYQYQNVLSEEDSVKLVKSVGNIKHVFSGDDHDYCELTHNDAKDNVREITVKSISMAMGVSIPGFLMVSLWNPVEPTTGKSLLEEGESSMQTHLCLLPEQIGTYMRYAMLGVLTVVVLAARAFLVPMMGWTPFALEGGGSGNNKDIVLPMYKDKPEPPHHRHSHKHGGGGHHAYSSSGAGSRFGGGSRGRGVSVSGSGSGDSSNGGAGGWSGSGSASLESRTRSPYATPNYGLDRSRSGKGKKRDRENGRWGWGKGGGPGLRIEIRTEDDDEDLLYSETGGSGSGKWKSKQRRAGGGGGLALKNAMREFGACLFRVVWMIGVLWGWLNWRG